MEKKDKKSKIKRQKSKNTTVDNAEPVMASIFEITELTLLILSYLHVTDWLLARLVSRQWHLLTQRRFILKSVYFNSFEYISSRYKEIINTSDEKDLFLAIKDSRHAIKLFGMPTRNMHADPQPDLYSTPGISLPACFGIPSALKEQDIIDCLFSEEPVWRSSWFKNERTPSNNQLFLLPHFQPHPFPQADALFSHLIFHMLTNNVIYIFAPARFLKIIIDKADHGSRSERKQAIYIICTWLANYPWTPELNLILDRFFNTASDTEQELLIHAKYMRTMERAIDWKMYEDKQRKKLNEIQLEALKARIDVNELGVNINMLDIPPEEMAKQIALCEQNCFRQLRFEHFVYEQRTWNVPEFHLQRRRTIASNLHRWLVSHSKCLKAASYLISLGQQLVKLRCYSAVAWIHDSLTAKAVCKLGGVVKAKEALAEEWFQIVRATQLKSDELERVLCGTIDLPAAQQPHIPSLSAVLASMNFVEIKLLWRVHGHISIKKVAKMCSWISLVLHCQCVPYLYEPVQPLQEFWEQMAQKTQGSKLK